MTAFEVDPDLDLVLERTVDVPVSLVWKAWTTPEHIKAWFAPRPWTVEECEVDLRPGGKFRTVMRSPDGESFDSVGCYLEIVEEKRLVWTDALLPGFRPAAESFFTGIITLRAQGDRTHYTATAVHNNEDKCARHKAMGFHDGWNTCLDQLVAHMKALP